MNAENQKLQNKIEDLTLQLDAQDKELNKNTKEIDNVNYKFMDVFFNYDGTSNRVEKAKEYLTDKGFLAAFPSGTKTSDLISSKMNDLKFYVAEENEGRYIYVSEFNQTITFGGKQNTVKRIVKTELVKTSDSWAVDKIELMN